jgi:hypothetical protein
MKKTKALSGSRLNAKELQLLHGLDDEYLEFRYNWEKRLQNALLALANSDPQWMIWVEKNVNLRWSLPRITRLIEAYTRARFLKPHGYFGRQQISSLIFRDDWCFTDRGTLSPG